MASGSAVPPMPRETGGVSMDTDEMQIPEATVENVRASKTAVGPAPRPETGSVANQPAAGQEDADVDMRPKRSASEPTESQEASRRRLMAILSALHGRPEGHVPTEGANVDDPDLDQPIAAMTRDSCEEVMCPDVQWWANPESAQWWDADTTAAEVGLPADLVAKAKQAEVSSFQKRGV